MSSQDAAQAGRPIFIVGCEGSGTTLLRLILNAHPHIAIPPESNFVPDVCREFSIAARFGPEAFQAIAQALYTDKFKLAVARLLQHFFYQACIARVVLDEDDFIGIPFHQSAASQQSTRNPQWSLQSL